MPLSSAIPVKEATPDDWMSRVHVQSLVLAALILLGVYVCSRLAMPFLAPLTWAVTLAVLFAPLQRSLERRLGRPTIAALITVVGILMMVAVPVSIVSQRLAIQAVRGADLVESRVKSGEWQRSFRAQPRLAPFVAQFERRIDLPGAMSTASAWVGNTAGVMVRGSILHAIEFALTFYLLFFLIRDRRMALQALRSLSPLGPREMDRLLDEVGDTLFATTYGTLVVSAVQGTLGGLMFWWLGLPAPLLWGVVMGLLSLVPVLGAFVVWVPGVLFLALEGYWGKALILAVWGGVVVGTADNLLRPILVGKRLRMHTVPTFISIVGGLVVFGMPGLILGPVVLTITTVLLETWSRRVGAEDLRRQSHDPRTVPFGADSAGEPVSGWCSCAGERNGVAP